MRTWLDIATLDKLKRMDGRFVAVAAAGLPFLLSEGMEVRLVPPATDAPRAVTVASVRDERASSAVVGFSEVVDAETAQRLVGMHCLVCADDLPEEAALSLTAASHGSIIGWRIEDAASGSGGEVIDAVDHPAQTTLTVRMDDGAEKLIPLAEELIVSVDEEAARIVMELPAGLLEL